MGQSLSRLGPVSNDLVDSTHYDKDKAAPTPAVIAMLPFEEEQDTNNERMPEVC
jgi:hypothetical protein